MKKANYSAQFIQHINQDACGSGIKFITRGRYSYAIGPVAGSQPGEWYHGVYRCPRGLEDVRFGDGSSRWECMGII